MCCWIFEGITIAKNQILINLKLEFWPSAETQEKNRMKERKKEKKKLNITENDMLLLFTSQPILFRPFHLNIPIIGGQLTPKRSMRFGQHVSTQ